VLEAYRMFAHDRGWVRRMREAIRNGLTAEAASSGAVRHPRAHAAPDRSRILRERLHDLRRPRQPAAARADGQGARAARRRAADNAIIVARNMGAAALLDYDRERCAAWCWRRRPDQPRRHRRARARHRRRRRGRERRPALVENGDADHRRRRDRRGASRPPPTSRRPMPRRCASARAGRSSTGAARQAGVTVDGVARRLMINAGLLVDLPHLEESGAEGHRPVPHRAAVHDRGDDARASASSLRSTARCSTPPATAR
jgi:phosphotransferase system, enzyme I, PtsP